MIAFESRTHGVTEGQPNRQEDDDEHERQVRRVIPGRFPDGIRYGRQNSNDSRTQKGLEQDARGWMVDIFRAGQLSRPRAHFVVVVAFVAVLVVLVGVVATVFFVGGSLDGSA